MFYLQTYRMANVMPKDRAADLIRDDPTLDQERKLRLLVHLNKPETTLLGVRPNDTTEFLVPFLEQQLQQLQGVYQPH